MSGSREVFYVPDSKGLRLPVIDVTHPSFALNVGPAEQLQLIRAFGAESQPLRKLPAPLRNLVWRVLLRKSVLAKGIQRVQRGGFMTGEDTYKMKLGPANLKPWGTVIDEKIAASVPCLSMRLRLQDMAQILAAAVRPLLEADRARPLHFVDIAGGPTMDVLNALIVLRTDAPSLLDGRAVSVHVLDGDDVGPRFGERALAELQSARGPLHGVSVSWHRRDYDWTHTAALSAVLAPIRAEGGIVAASSEGGLFEYGTDDDIVNNLIALRLGSPRDVIVAGSVTRGDEFALALKKTSPSKTRPRGIPVFEKLTERAGFRIVRYVERPLSDQVLLAAS